MHISVNILKVTELDILNYMVYKFYLYKAVKKNSSSNSTWFLTYINPKFLSLAVRLCIIQLLLIPQASPQAALSLTLYNVFFQILQRTKHLPTLVFVFPATIFSAWNAYPFPWLYLSYRSQFEQDTLRITVSDPAGKGESSVSGSSVKLS